MKATEIMIGDWVRVPSELNRYMRVRSTFDMDSAILYEPIPLTPEILKKNGFIKHDRWNEWAHYTNIIFIDFTLLVDEDGFHLDIPNARINYVHQLQHALRLCGIKKEIVL